jgi:hypothetical protein
VHLACQPAVVLEDLGPVAAGSSGAVQAAPELAALLADDEALRDVADALSGADAPGFGMVTASPTPNTGHVDRIPGSGRNRYFYKVRAVFAGETRSAWSASSVAFHQVDLSDAAVPVVHRADRTAGGIRIILERPAGPGVLGIRILRGDQDVPGQQAVGDWLLDPPSGGRALAPAPIRARGRLVDLRAIAGGESLSLTVEPRIVAVHPLTAAGEVDEAVDLLAGATLGRTALQLPAGPPGPIAVRIRHAADDLRTHTELPGLVEIDLTAADAGDNAVWAQTLRAVTHPGGTVRRDSPPVRVS